MTASDNRPELLPQFAKFLVTGGIAAIVNIISRYLLSDLMLFEVAVTIAYLIGMTTAFFLAKLFVFPETGGSAQGKYARFALVNLLSLAMVWGVSVGLLRGLFPLINFTWHAEMVAHVIGVVSPAVPSFWGHRNFTFGVSAPSNDENGQ